MAFVDELLAGGGYRRVELAHTLMLVQKVGEGAATAPVVHAPAVMASTPLVSCIMPTANRRALVAQAIAYFQRQDYPNRELVIVDDGQDCVEDLVGRDPRIRYERLPHVRTMGAKHNRACELARGEIVVHWDDDDWMAPWRVSYQVADLQKSRDTMLCGLSTLHFYDPESRRAWRYVYPAASRAWVSGGTFCYRKTLWESHRLPELNEGADTRYVWGLPEGQIYAHQDPDFYVATIHRRNTSPRRLYDARYQRCPVEAVESLLGEDLDFYRSWPLAG
jgi:glycosyltransferase involved in cell wall biosynthesis